MKRFPPAFLEELKSRITLSQVVGKRVALRKAGREHQGLCPFHNEKTPSFTVSDDKGFYHCFGCGAHGDAIRFLTDREGLSYPEAVERLANDAGLPIPHMRQEDAERYRKAQTLLDVMEEACGFFQKALHDLRGVKAREYLANRGISPAMVAEFRLGFAPDTRGSLKNHLAAKGIGEAQMVEAGLLIRPDSGLTYDRFRGRLIFPILDERGRVIAFGGRILEAGEPKYLNSPETPLFHKQRVLYGLSHARPGIREANSVIVAEGYMDVIALHQGGIRNTVAPLGTAVTEHHLQMLWRAAPEPVMCLDGDAAGLRAMTRAARLAVPMLAPGYSLRFARLPKGDDPDSLIRRQGAEAMRTVLAQAIPLSEALWEAEGGREISATPERAAEIETKLMQLAASIKQPQVSKNYASFFREKLWEARRAARKKTPGAARQATAALLRPSPAALAAKLHAPGSAPDAKLLALTCICPALLAHAEVEETLGTVSWGEARLEKLRGALLNFIAEDQPLEPEALNTYLKTQGLPPAKTLFSLRDWLDINGYSENGEAQALAHFRLCLDEWHDRQAQWEAQNPLNADTEA